MNASGSSNKTENAHGPTCTSVNFKPSFVLPEDRLMTLTYELTQAIHVLCANSQEKRRAEQGGYPVLHDFADQAQLGDVS